MADPSAIPDAGYPKAPGAFLRHTDLIWAHCVALHADGSDHVPDGPEAYSPMPIVVYSGAGGRPAGEGTLYDLYLSKLSHGKALLAAVAILPARPDD